MLGKPLLGFMQSGHLLFVKAPSTLCKALQTRIIKHFSFTDSMCCKTQFNVFMCVFISLQKTKCLYILQSNSHLWEVGSKS